MNCPLPLLGSLWCRGVVRDLSRHLNNQWSKVRLSSCRSEPSIAEKRSKSLIAEMDGSDCALHPCSAHWDPGVGEEELHDYFGPFFPHFHVVVCLFFPLFLHYASLFSCLLLCLFKKHSLSLKVVNESWKTI